MELTKQKKRSKFYWAFASGAAVLAFAASLSTGAKTVHADASSMANMPTANKIEPGEKLDGSYSFVPNVIPGKTTVTPFGSGVKWATSDFPDIGASYGTQYLAFPTEDPASIAAKGKMGVLYTNVGTYNNRQIDLKLTVLDWQNNQAAVSPDPEGHYYGIGTDKVDVYIPGTHSAMSVRYDYIDHETKKPVQVKGYLSFYDLDKGQGLYLSKDMLAKVQDTYYTDDTYLGYRGVNGGAMIFGQDGKESNSVGPDDKFGAFTFNYGPSDHVEFTWVANEAGNSITDPYASLSRGYYAGSESDVAKVNYTVSPDTFKGAYLEHSAKAILKSLPKEPLKRVTDSDETDVTDNMLKDRYETYTYKIKHQVPDELPEFYYGTYVLKDTFKDILSIDKDKIKIFNSSGNDVTTQFDIVQKGQTIEANAKTTFLKGPSFYGEEYTMEVPTELKPGMSLKLYEDPDKANQARVDNKAKAIVDSIDVDSNEVHTRVPFRDPKAEKFVSNDSKGTTKELNVDFNKDYVYTINVTVPDKLANLDTVKIVDDLEDVQRVQKVQVFDVLTGKDITDQGTLDSFDDKGDVELGEATKPNIVWTAKEPDKYHGKELKMLVTTKMVNIPDLQTYLDKATGRIKVPNVGKLIYNEFNLPTPPTIVTPPDVKGSVDKKIEVFD